MAKFAQGNPGRPKGSKNKTTALLKDAIIKAAQNAGGGGPDGVVEYLTVQAGKNPQAFMPLLGKVLPLQVQGDMDQRVVVEIKKFD